MHQIHAGSCYAWLDGLMTRTYPDLYMVMLQTASRAASPTSHRVWMFVLDESHCTVWNTRNSAMLMRQCILKTPGDHDQAVLVVYLCIWEQHHIFWIQVI